MTEMAQFPHRRSRIDEGQYTAEQCGPAQSDHEVAYPLELLRDFWFVVALKTRCHSLSNYYLRKHAGKTRLKNVPKSYP